MEIPNVSSAPVDPFQTCLEHFAKLRDGTHNRREKLIVKLEKILDKLDIDPTNDNAKLIESKLGAFTTLDSLMKSQETAMVNQAKLTIMHKATEQDVDIGHKMTEMLKAISLAKINSRGKGPAVDDQQLDAIQGLAPVRPEELRIGSRNKEPKLELDSPDEEKAPEDVD